MICRANGVLPNFFEFKFFFRLCATSDKYTFFIRKGGYTLVPDGQTPKKQQDKWLWVNQDRVGCGRHWENKFSGVTPKLYPHNHAIADLLKAIHVVPEVQSEVLLTGVGMCHSQRHRGKMPIFYTVTDGEQFYYSSFSLPHLSLFVGKEQGTVSCLAIRS